MLPRYQCLKNTCFASSTLALNHPGSIATVSVSQGHYIILQFLQNVEEASTTSRTKCQTSMSVLAKPLRSFTHSSSVFCLHTWLNSSTAYLWVKPQGPRLPCALGLMEVRWADEGPPWRWPRELSAYLCVWGVGMEYFTEVVCRIPNEREEMNLFISLHGTPHWRCLTHWICWGSFLSDPILDDFVHGIMHGFPSRSCDTSQQPWVRLHWLGAHNYGTCNTLRHWLCQKN